jgi:hypothetical protein
LVGRKNSARRRLSLSTKLLRAGFEPFRGCGLPGASRTNKTSNSQPIQAMGSRLKTRALAFMEIRKRWARRVFLPTVLR